MEISNEISLALNEAVTFADSLSVRVADNSDYEQASTILRDIKGRLARLEILRREITKPLDESKKRVMDLFRVPVERLEIVESRIKAAMLAFQRAIEDARAVAEAKAIEERRKLEAAREKAMAKGDWDRAVQVSQKSAEVRINAPPPVAKIAGVQTREIWKWRVVDANKIPREFLIPDEAKLGRLARELKGEAKVEGVEFFSETMLASARE
jgi:hypothetical protein